MLFRLISLLILAALLIVGAVLASALILVGGFVLATFLVRLWWRTRPGAASVTRENPVGSDLIEGEYTVEREGAASPRVPENLPRRRN